MCVCLCLCAIYLFGGGKNDNHVNYFIYSNWYKFMFAINLLKYSYLRN